MITAVAEADGQIPRLLARYSSARDSATALLGTAKPVAAAVAWAAPCAGVAGEVFGWAALRSHGRAESSVSGGSVSGGSV